MNSCKYCLGLGFISGQLPGENAPCPHCVDNTDWEIADQEAELAQVNAAIDLVHRAMDWVREFRLDQTAQLSHGPIVWDVYFSPTCGKVVEMKSEGSRPTSVYMADKAAVRRRWSNRIRNGARVLNL